ncbi:MAG: YggS family pyridoxal phosphate-dependent enzyme [Bdellovibrionales bacterium]
MSSIVENLREVTRSIRAASEKVGRTAGSVTLVAVSKTHPVTSILEVLQAGQRVFGENRVQEAMGKFPELKRDFPDLELHLIGPLQTNKVPDAVGFFDVIETLDRPKLARALAKEIQKQGRAPRLYLQINTGAEPQKAGVLPEHAPALLALCRDELGLTIEGLMCVPPAQGDPAPHFDLLKEMARKEGLSVLSMGMSADYPIAIAHGSTHVRVGTAIFGARPVSFTP